MLEFIIPFELRAWPADSQCIHVARSRATTGHHSMHACIPRPTPSKSSWLDPPKKSLVPTQCSVLLPASSDLSGANLSGHLEHVLADADQHVAVLATSELARFGASVS